MKLEKTLTTASCVSRMVALGLALEIAPLSIAQAAKPSVVAPGGEVKKLAGGFAFTEGPAADRDGNIYFSDIPNNRILRWSTDGQLSTFRENSGGANGLCFDKQGNLLACKGGAPKIDVDLAGRRSDGAGRQLRRQELNSPNDLWIDPLGGVYFSDPPTATWKGRATRLLRLLPRPRSQAADRGDYRHGQAEWRARLGRWQAVVRGRCQRRKDVRLLAPAVWDARGSEAVHRARLGRTRA